MSRSAPLAPRKKVKTDKHHMTVTPLRSYLHWLRVFNKPARGDSKAAKRALYVVTARARPRYYMMSSDRVGML